MERTYTGAAPLTLMPPGATDCQMHMYLPGYPALPGGPPVPAGRPGPEDYRQVMRWLGIDRVVITQGNSHQRDNANLLACLTEMGDLARGVAVITGEEAAPELARLASAGIVGARIMDLPGGAVGLDTLERVGAIAAEMGWMMAVQFDGGKLLEMEGRLSRLKCRWVLDHHGKFFAGITPEGPEAHALLRLIDTGRCWYKVAGCYESSREPWPYADIASITRLIAAHAPERIVWGTNWPHNLAKTSADYPNDAALLDLTLGWLPSEAARHQALVANPAELFDWEYIEKT